MVRALPNVVWDYGNEDAEVKPGADGTAPAALQQARRALRACRVGEVMAELRSPRSSSQSAAAAPLGSARLRVAACVPARARGFFTLPQTDDLSSHVQRPCYDERRLFRR